ncbi:MAG: hypothetical protein D6702_01960 [Planctomycetota bacterium]|nr:MAG: hypothetical protein D6702_01960 [Planctomycetota bacterium]
MSRLTPFLLLSAGLIAGDASAQEADAALPGHRLIEVRANTFEYNRQVDPTLAVAEDGRILVAWGSRRQEHGTFGVFAQLLDPLGRPLGTEIHVNEYMPDGQMEPAAAWAPDGSAWVTWCSIGQDGSRGGIFLRRLAETVVTDEEGNESTRFGPVGPEILVNETTPGDQQDAAVAVDASGRILVAWISEHPGAETAFARFFGPDGRPLGGEFRLGQDDSGRERLPNLVALGDRFAAAWSRTDLEGRPQGIFGRILSADGRLGEEFRMTPEDGRQHVEPCLDTNGSDRLALAWMASPDGEDWEVYSRLFDAAGEPLGEAAPIGGQDPGYRNGATVAMAPDGRYLVAWNVHRAKEARPVGRRPIQQVDVFAQAYDADGRPSGERFIVNRERDGEQTLQVGLNARHAAWSGLGQLALAWHGRIGADSRGVGLSLFAPEGLDLPAPPEIEPVAACTDVTLADLEAQLAPPEWDPNWVDDSYLPNPGPQGPDFGFTAFSSTGWNPPDPDLAVGPNHIVAVVNVDMKVFDKNGNQTFSTPLEPFFNTTGFVFDPVALYDPHSGRYIIGAVEHLGNTDRYHIGVSTSSDPSSGSFYKYVFDINSICDFVDFPNLGVGSDAIYLVADCFGNGRNYIHVMPKAPMLSGGPATKTSIVNEYNIVSTGATKNYDANGIGYFASSYARGTPYIRIYAVENTSSPTRSYYDLFVGSFSNPPDAQQLGTSNRADTIDHRIKNGVVRNGIMYLTHAVDGGDGAAKVRWYKIDLRGFPTSGSNPILLDSGYVDEGYNVDSWFGDVNVDANGNMAIAFNRSSPNEYIGVYRTFRMAGDPAGTVRAGVEMQTSTSPEGGSRWGDYSGLEEDPAQPGTFWNHHEYRTSSWRTWIGHFAVDLGLQLTATPLVRGTTATLTATNAADGETVWFLYSLAGQGSGPCPPQLGGLCLDILNPITIIGSAVSSGGTAVYSVAIPSGAPLVPVWMQAVVQRGVGNVDSIKSNVHTDTIQ